MKKIILFAVTIFTVIYGCSFNPPTSSFLDMVPEMQLLNGSNYLRAGQAAVSFNGRLYVSGGYTAGFIPLNRNNVISSVDGKSWVEESSDMNIGNVSNHKTLVLNDKVWMIHGNMIYSSDDAVNYTYELSTAFGPVVDAVVHGSNLYIFTSDGVYSSSNGVDWDIRTTTTAYDMTSGFRVVSFNNKLWVIGGKKGTLTNEIWSSENGFNWVSENMNPAFEPRSDFTALVVGGKIWIAGGRAVLEHSTVSNLYNSSDGVNWVKVANSEYIGTFDNASCVHNGQGYFFDGMFEEPRSNGWTYDVKETIWRTNL